MGNLAAELGLKPSFLENHNMPLTKIFSRLG